MRAQGLIDALEIPSADMVSGQYSVVVKVDDVSPPMRDGHRQQSNHSEESKVGKNNGDVGIHAVIKRGVKQLVNRKCKTTFIAEINGLRIMLLETSSSENLFSKYLNPEAEALLISGGLCGISSGEYSAGPGVLKVEPSG